jgi:DNA mismatch repair protein MSH2
LLAKDVHRLYNFSVRNLPAIMAALAGAGDGDEAAADLLARFLAPLAQCASDLAPFQALVEHVLDFSQLPELRIQPQHSPALGELAEERDATEETVRLVHAATQEEWARVCSKGVIRLEPHKEEGWVLRLPSASDEQRLRKEIPQIKILGILKSGVVFTTDELRAAAADARAVAQRYADEQKVVADKVVATAATFVPVVECAARLVAELDVLASFAHVAAHAPGGDYVRPTFCADGDGEAIKLVGARHPCVELQDGVAFIANDYAFDRDTAQFQLVTGPNMGGKSTYIRGLGSIVAMAQAGSFVPCREATLPLVDTILARVGAGDSQARGLSTFMAEMLEASTIVRTATARSLVRLLRRAVACFWCCGAVWCVERA